MQCMIIILYLYIYNDTYYEKRKPSEKEQKGIITLKEPQKEEQNIQLNDDITREGKQEVVCGRCLERRNRETNVSFPFFIHF